MERFSVPSQKLNIPSREASSASASAATTPTNEKGILSWVKTALTNPLVSTSTAIGLRSSTSSPAPHDAGAKGNASATEPTTPRPGASISGAGKASPADPFEGARGNRTRLPARNLEADFGDHSQSASERSSFDSSSIAGLSSAYGEGDDLDSFGHGVDDDDGASVSDEEELYVPYKPTNVIYSEPQPLRPGEDLPRVGAHNEGSDGDTRNAPQMGQQPALPGLVKPTARRSISLNHGHSAELEADVARLNSQGGKSSDRLRSAQQDGDGSAAGLHDVYSSKDWQSPSRTGSLVDDSSSHVDSIRSTPSLVLTPPDSKVTEEIVSPLVAGWAGPESPPPTGSMQLPYNNAPAGDGESIEAATGAQPRPSRESIALGSRTAAIRHHERRESQILEESLAEDAAQNWDEARAKTPKAFADLLPQRQGSRSSEKGTFNSEALALQLAADEIAGIEAPTPKPDQGRGRDAARRVASEATPAPPSPKTANPITPSRRRLFGGRKRPGTASEAVSGSGEEGAVQDAAPSPEPSTRTSSAPFWKLKRRNSVSSRTSSARLPSSPTKQPIMPSESVSSGFSVAIPHSVASSAAGSRPASIRSQVDPKGGRHHPWGKGARVKIKPGVGLNGVAQPKKVKTRSKNVPPSEQHFSNLYLVQELYLGIPTPDEVLQAELAASAELSRMSLDSGSAASAVSSPGSPPQDRRGTSMPGAQSQSSLNSFSSTAPPSSGMSHSTVGSYGAHGKRRATWAMKFSLDGRFLAIAGQDAIIRIFEVLNTPAKRQKEAQESAEQAARLDAFEKAEASAKPDSSHAASSKARKQEANDQKAQTKSFPAFASRPIRELQGHTADVLCLDWSKNGFLVSSSMDKTAKVWHMSKPDCLITFCHSDFVTSAQWLPRDDRFMLTGCLDGKLRLWNVAGKRVHASVDVPGLITATAFSASGSTAIAGTFSGALLFYETETLTYQSSLAIRPSSGKNARGRKITGIEPVMLVTPTESGSNGVHPTKIEELILVSSNDSRVRTISLADKRLTSKYKAKTYLNRTSQIRASSADDAFVVAGSESGEVFIWNWAKEPVGLAAMGKRAAAGGGGGSSSGAVTTSERYESWTAADHARPVTVALLAPLKTHAHLTSSEDPVELHSAITSQGRSPVPGNGGGAATTAFSALGLAGALSAAMPSAGAGAGGGAGGGVLGGGGSSAHPPAWDPLQNRIVVSVDESQVVRVWRAVRDEHVISA